MIEGDFNVIGLDRLIGKYYKHHNVLLEKYQILWWPMRCVEAFIIVFINP